MPSRNEKDKTVIRAHDLIYLYLDSRPHTQ